MMNKSIVIQYFLHFGDEVVRYSENKKLIFDHSYNDTDDINSYIGNFEELQSLIMEEVKKNHTHYSALPSYIVEQLAL